MANTERPEMAYYKARVMKMDAIGIDREIRRLKVVLAMPARSAADENRWVATKSRAMLELAAVREILGRSL